MDTNRMRSILESNFREVDDVRELVNYLSYQGNEKIYIALRMAFECGGEHALRQIDKKISLVRDSIEHRRITLWEDQWENGSEDVACFFDNYFD